MSIRLTSPRKIISDSFSLAAYQVNEDDDATIRLEVRGQAFQIELAMLDIVEDVVKKSNVEIVYRQVRVVAIAEDRFEIADSFFAGAPVDVIDQFAVDLGDNSRGPAGGRQQAGDRTEFAEVQTLIEPKRPPTRVAPKRWTGSRHVRPSLSERPRRRNPLSCRRGMRPAASVAPAP
jgi:hypothetical protein